VLVDAVDERSIEIEEECRFAAGHEISLEADVGWALAHRLRAEG